MIENSPTLMNDGTNDYKNQDMITFNNAEMKTPTTPLTVKQHGINGTQIGPLVHSGAPIQPSVLLEWLL